jgi:transposase
MAGKRLSMRKIREIIRLHHTTELSDRRIASACNASPTTVGRVVKAVERSGLAWPLPDDLSDSEIESLLFEKHHKNAAATRPLPDMERVARDLKKKHVTLQLIWEEYRREHPNGYSYTRLCELYRQWKRTRDPVMRQEHEAGDKMFVDWAGQTLRYTDEHGVQHEAYMFVVALGASNYIYANIFPDMRLGSWLRAHVEAFEFYGGVLVRRVYML